MYRQYLVLDSKFVVGGTWIADPNRMREAETLEHAGNVPSITGGPSPVHKLSQVSILLCILRTI